jgi:YVTN family beta-propeller protein
LNKPIVLLLSTVALGLGMTVSRTGEPDYGRIVAQPGQTIADFIPEANFYEQTNVDPGIAPEGDYMDRVIFTRDGAKAIVSNRMTGNITVFDWATMTAENTVDVGSYPAGMAVTDSLLVICRPFADSVTVVRLRDWAVLARLPSGGQPWVVKTSPDGTRAFVGCDISNTCEVYDLVALTRASTIADFPFYLVTVSWNSENGRFAANFCEFDVTRDGSHIIAPDTGNFIYWIDVATGVKDDTVAGLGRCWFVRYSGDSTRLITAKYSTPAVVYAVDAAARAVADSVVITGYGIYTIDAAANMDGTKAFLGTSNNTSTLVKFATHDFVTFTQTYSAFWLGASPDHAKAISGQYNFSIIDFATEVVTGQHSGNSQSYGAISPVGYRAVGFDPMRHEGLYFYDYTNPTPVYRGTTNSGTPPEGDAPHRVKLSPDGSTCIATSVLSDNLSIIDVPTLAVETIIPLGDRPQDIAFTSDSRRAVVTGLNGNNVGIVDLSDNSMTVVGVGSGPATVVITPNDSFAYVGNIGSNTVSCIRLADHQVIASIPAGEIGIVWGSYGVWSGLAMSPTGRYCLVAASFDDQVHVIETSTNTVVATLPTGDFPLCIAFDSTGEYATVTNYMAGSYTVMHIDGANSAVVATRSSGQYAMRIAYNPAFDQIGIGNYGAKTISIVNPRTGVLISTISYTSYGALNGIDFDLDGNPVVLTASVGNFLGHVHKGSDHIELPAVPSQFDYCSATGMAAVAGPGPDFVTLVDFSPSGIVEARPVSLHPRLGFTIGPNPCRGTAVVRAPLASRPSPLALRVFDSSGRLVLRSSFDIRTSSLRLDLRSLPPGVYLARLTTDGHSTTKQLIVQH